MTPLDKKALSERDICTKFITPALGDAGWDFRPRFARRSTSPRAGSSSAARRSSGARRSGPTTSSSTSRTSRSRSIEAKDNNHAVGDGMQQALDYAEMPRRALRLQLQRRRASSSTTARAPSRRSSSELALDEFPSPDELWQRYCAVEEDSTPESEADRHPGLLSTTARQEPRATTSSSPSTATSRPSPTGQNRILLVMATGTGKTYTAFQIIWRLWKAGVKKRILFLADRNILVDQTKTNDFKPFGEAMTKIQNRKVDKSFEIYLALYQAVTGTEEEQNIYKQFSPDFFDLVVVDECHRGSAADDSAWREILDYFSSATQIGLTATPKETQDVSNIDYFGDPIYTYSLKQGIEDGFLAPYKVVRIDLDKDLDGWRPSRARRDKHGEVIEDRDLQPDATSTAPSCSRSAPSWSPRRSPSSSRAPTASTRPSSSARTSTTPSGCGRPWSTRTPTWSAENRKYVMRITGDNEEGKAELDNFIDPEQRYPVIATTSKLMTTGVDAQTCKLIVLDQTHRVDDRVQADHRPRHPDQRGLRQALFTIMDFKKATELFADPDFDGDPVQIYEPGAGRSPVPPDDEPSDRAKTKRRTT